MQFFLSQFYRFPVNQFQQDNSTQTTFTHTHSYSGIKIAVTEPLIPDPESPDMNLTTISKSVPCNICDFGFANLLYTVSTLLKYQLQLCYIHNMDL